MRIGNVMPTMTMRGVQLGVALPQAWQEWSAEVLNSVVEPGRTQLPDMLDESSLMGLRDRDHQSHRDDRRGSRRERSRSCTGGSREGITMTITMRTTNTPHAKAQGPAPACSYGREYDSRALMDYVLLEEFIMESYPNYQYKWMQAPPEDSWRHHNAEQSRSNRVNETPREPPQPPPHAIQHAASRRPTASQTLSFCRLTWRNLLFLRKGWAGRRPRRPSTTATGLCTGGQHAGYGRGPWGGRQGGVPMLFPAIRFGNGSSSRHHYDGGPEYHHGALARRRLIRHDADAPHPPRQDTNNLRNAATELGTTTTTLTAQNQSTAPTHGADIFQVASDPLQNLFAMLVVYGDELMGDDEDLQHPQDVEWATGWYNKLKDFLVELRGSVEDAPLMLDTCVDIATQGEEAPAGIGSSALSSTPVNVLTQTQLHQLQQAATELQRQEDQALQDALRRPTKATRRVQVEVMLQSNNGSPTARASMPASQGNTSFQIQVRISMREQMMAAEGDDEGLQEPDTVETSLMQMPKSPTRELLPALHPDIRLRVNRRIRQLLLQRLQILLRECHVLMREQRDLTDLYLEEVPRNIIGEQVDPAIEDDNGVIEAVAGTFLANLQVYIDNLLLIEEDVDIYDIIVQLAEGLDVASSTPLATL